jgi:putative SOS response-associated peptidase YedK
MCGRYIVEGVQEISERFQLRDIGLPFAPTFNAAPSELLPVVIADDDGERQLRLLRWGLIPKWSKPGSKGVQPINARVETLREKPMFRPLLSRHRCIVPASGYYEWRVEGGVKQPYFLTTKDREVFGFAGLYDETTDPEADGPAAAATGSYTIITAGAHESLATFHDRMPVILRPEHEADWLSRDVTDPLEIEQLLNPRPASEMLTYPVSKAVNNVRNDSPDLIEPIEIEEPSRG